MNFKLSGDKELIAKLNGLKKSTGNALLRRAVTAAARPVRAAMKAHAPKDTGTLKRSIDFIVKTYPKAVIAIIGVRSDTIEILQDRKTGRIRRVRPVKYYFLQEFGTSKSPAHPFLRPAFGETAGAAEAIISAKLLEGIEGAT